MFGLNWHCKRAINILVIHSNIHDKFQGKYLRSGKFLPEMGTMKQFFKNHIHNYGIILI
jgi:hypothetical protein